MTPSTESNTTEPSAALPSAEHVAEPVAETSPAPKPARAPKRSRGVPAVDYQRRFEILFNTTRLVSGTDSLDEMLASLVELTSKELRCERSSFLLNDPEAGELFSRAAQGIPRRELRFPNTEGIAGTVFHSGSCTIVSDAYADPRFNKTIDQETGFVTKNLLCVPLRTVKGEIVGVAQCLNKIDGHFTEEDQNLLQEIGVPAVPALVGSQFAERMSRVRAQEMDFLNIVADITSELDLGALLQRVMGEATRMLNAERSTLFLHDDESATLFSRVAQGAKLGEIRLPNHAGIAGAVFTTGKTINIPHAYADLRFNPSFDRQTGFFTRSILCTPVVNKQGKTIGVTQVLNKRSGPFSHEDESRLKAFTGQVAIALENAKLFEDVQKIKNYNEGMLQSMSNGVITLDEVGKIVTCNASGCRIMQLPPAEIIGRSATDLFTGKNLWVLERVAHVKTAQQVDVSMDAELDFTGTIVSANLSVLPLKAGDDMRLGTMLMIEDISTEKRVKATMSRYMDPAIAAQMLESGGSDLLGGASTRATVLFSDIRGFTTLTEELGAQGTVAFLNEYFTIMVECINQEGGMLDKFIGDAIMAAFGLPIGHEDDEDRAVRAAIAMIRGCRRYSEERVRRGQRPIAMGIGLNTDMVVSGNIGSARRMDYTLIGDGVNLASRLESACKAYAAEILISDSTYRRLRGTYRAREIDRVVVKGKTEPVSVYEVLEYHDDETFPNMMDVLGHFAEGLRRYRNAEFKEAIDQFQKGLEKNPKDRLSEIYIARCEYLIAHPPEGEWTGVWVMKEK